MQPNQLINRGHIKLGITFALIASLCNTITSVFVKIIGNDQGTTTVIFSRFIIGLVILLPWFITDRDLLKVGNKIKVLSRCITSVLAMTCVFYSLKFMPVANVLLLNNTFPLFLPILSWVLLGIKTPSKMLIGMIIGFIGVAFALHPNTATFNWYAVISLFSGLLAALAMFQIRLLTKESTNKQILFYLFLFGSIATALFLPLGYQTPTKHEIVLLFFVGLFGAGYQLFLTLALNYANARIVSPIYFSCIIFAAIFDWLIWSISFTLMQLIGMSLIMLGGILTLLFAN